MQTAKTRVVNVRHLFVCVYNQMMAAEERMYPDKLKEVERLFRQMKLDGLEPEVPTYNSVIYG